MSQAALDRFASDYAAHRQAEGRGYSTAELLALPFLRTGPLARQWAVRARTFDAFRILTESMAAGRSLNILDLGAGNGWLSYRMALAGHACTAIDIRGDDVDGLGAAAPLVARSAGRMRGLVGSFDSIPLAEAAADIAVFNASLHYSTDLAATLTEAARVVRPGGTLAILDSPFYESESDGAAMVAEKHSSAGDLFGSRADVLLGLPFIEFLTRARLAEASGALGLRWFRRRVCYPLAYELRPIAAALSGKRRPSRFDLWVAERP